MMPREEVSRGVARMNADRRTDDLVTDEIHCEIRSENAELKNLG
jgi:hypothetical protein